MKLCWRRTSQRRKQPDQGLEEMATKQVGGAMGERGRKRGERERESKELDHRELWRPFDFSSMSDGSPWRVLST